ncbi:AraC family transcriptional regulator [Xanthomonas campestris pv. phormiicola]|nr:AraC family transcriptional regulator [Xanthomonas campestris pv. phormiicola]UYC14626.1 AraC family transcriptional regulator [Xanthomonas campestris pv. phormiicola]
MRSIPSRSPQASAGDAGSPGLAGHLSQYRVLRPGLGFHFGSEVEREDYVARGVDEDCLRIVLVLEGAVDVAYDGHRVRLAAPRRAAPPGAPMPDLAIVGMPRPAEFRRVVRRGDYARRISIGLGREWLEQCLMGGGHLDASAADAFIGGYPGGSCRRASAAMRALAERMLNPPPLPAPLLAMYLEARALNLVVEACAQQGLAQAAPAPAALRPLRPAVYRRMCEVRDFLRDNPSLPLRIDELARRVGASAATLQRQFRSAHGISVGAFVQQRRLELARLALERDGVSVARAALLAGYASPANFATAFRRRYGVAPGRLRGRV